MKKGLLAVMIIIYCMSFTVLAEGDVFEISIDNEVLDIPVNMGKAHIDENGRSLVPARAIIEGLGYEVKWIADSRNIVIVDGSKEIASLTIGSNKVFLEDNKIIEMDTSAVIGGDSRTYVPLRFVSKALGFDIPSNGGYRYENGVHYVKIVPKKEDLKINETNKSQLNSLVEDIKYFNETSLGEKEDKLGIYELSNNGVLMFDYREAMITMSKKIELGRTDSNTPILHIGEWKESKDIVRSLCKDIIMYYAKDKETGNKIYDKINWCIVTDNRPVEDKIVMGDTVIALADRREYKDADLILIMDEDIFSVGINDVTEEKGIRLVIDMKAAKVHHYDNKGLISIDVIGSVNNSILRAQTKSTFEEDIVQFNKILGKTEWKLDSEGKLNNSYIEIEKFETGDVIVKIRNWEREKDKKSESSMVITMNLAMEALKYYAENQEEGEAIWWYIDVAVKEGKEISNIKKVEFGKTVVEFADPGSFGIDVHILKED